MLTLDKLREFGADVDDALVRCMNKEDFYIMLVSKTVSDTKLYQLEQQINARELSAAFETAHALKGVYANLSLTPLTLPVSEMIELLRSRSDTDYSALMEEAKTQFRKLCEL